METNPLTLPTLYLRNTLLADKLFHRDKNQTLIIIILAQKDQLIKQIIGYERLAIRVPLE
jgi:hypothetical protein